MIKSRLIMPEINQEFDVQYNENAQVCDVITDTLDVVSQYLRTVYVNREHWVLVLPRDRKSTRLNSSHNRESRMPSSA